MGRLPPALDVVKVDDALLFSLKKQFILFSLKEFFRVLKSGPDILQNSHQLLLFLEIGRHVDTEHFLVFVFQKMGASSRMRNYGAVCL